MTWVSYDLGGFQYVRSRLVSIRASGEEGRNPFLRFPTERLGILGEHKLWPLAAALQLLNIVTEGLEEFINHVGKVTHLHGHLWGVGVCACVCVSICVLNQDSLAHLSSASPIYKVLCLPYLVCMVLGDQTLAFVIGGKPKSNISRWTISSAFGSPW